MLPCSSFPPLWAASCGPLVIGGGVQGAWHVIFVFIYREYAGGAYYSDDRHDDGSDCVGGHEHAQWMGGRKVRGWGRLDCTLTLWVF